MTNSVHAFHKTRPGYVVFGFVEITSAYVFGSLAVNSGSLWEWALAALLLLGTLQNLGRLIWKFIRVKA